MNNSNYDSQKILSLLSECEKEIIYWKNQYESLLESQDKKQKYIHQNQEQEYLIQLKNKEIQIEFLQEQLKENLCLVESYQQENVEKRQENLGLEQKVSQVKQELQNLQVLYEKDQKKILEMNQLIQKHKESIKNLEEQIIVKDDLISELKKRNTYNEYNMNQLAQEFQRKLGNQLQKINDKPNIFQKNIPNNIYQQSKDAITQSQQSNLFNLSKNSNNQTIVSYKLQIKLQLSQDYYKHFQDEGFHDKYIKIYLADIEEIIEVNQQMDIEINEQLLEESLQIQLYQANLQIDNKINILIQDIQIQKMLVHQINQLDIVLTMF